MKYSDADAPTAVATAYAGAPRPPGHRCQRCFGEVDGVGEKEGRYARESRAR
jgi:hypothetical protein